MALDNLTLLINRYKRAVEMNEDGSYDDKEDAAKDALIAELEKGEKGIIITRTEKYKFTTADISDYRWLLEELLHNDSGLSIEEIFYDDYQYDSYHYEGNGLELKNEVTITDLNGNQI